LVSFSLPPPLSHVTISLSLSRSPSFCSQDGDGTINREEWRRWMLEKEEIIRKGNHEKAQLIQVIIFPFLLISANDLHATNRKIRISGRL
jgi:hypothetical protein